MPKHLGSTKYLVVEVEASRPVEPMNQDIKESLAALRHAPGFQWLLSRLKEQGALLKAKLQSERQSDLRDVEFLQSGIYWTGWLESAMRKAAQYKEPVRSAPTPDQQDLFTRLAEDLEPAGISL